MSENPKYNPIQQLRTDLTLDSRSARTSSTAPSQLSLRENIVSSWVLPIPRHCAPPRQTLDFVEPILSTDRHAGKGRSQKIEKPRTR